MAGEDEEGGDRKRRVENESSQAKSSIPDGRKTVMAFTNISKQKCTKKFHSFVLQTDVTRQKCRFYPQMPARPDSLAGCSGRKCSCEAAGKSFHCSGLQRPRHSLSFIIANFQF